MKYVNDEMNWMESKKDDKCYEKKGIGSRRQLSSRNNMHLL